MEPVDALEPGEQQLAPKTCRKHVPHTTNTVDYRSGQEGDKLRPETKTREKGDTHKSPTSRRHV